jgi:hypothetical protein
MSARLAVAVLLTEIAGLDWYDMPTLGSVYSKAIYHSWGT